MKNYDIVEINTDQRKMLIVFSTNYISPLKAIREIQSSICNITNDVQEIYFDFLMCNRNEHQRYAKINCMNGVLNLKDFSYVSVNKKSELRKMSAIYYKDNEKNLDWTYAGETKRKMIINNIVI